MAAPTSPRVPRHDGWTPRIRAAFLEALATTGMVRPALASVGRSASAAYALRRRNPEFRAAWDAALVDAVVPVETMLVERALSGEWVRTLGSDGREIGSEHRFDSRFALRLLTRLDRNAERASSGILSPAIKSRQKQHNPQRSAQSVHKAESHPTAGRP
jgi:hypothetical protein